MSHTQHFLDSGMKVYGALNSLTTDFLQFGQVSHMAAQGLGEFCTHDVQFRNDTEA